MSRLYPRLDWFLPVALRSDKDAVRRARMFVVTHLFGTPIGFLVSAGIYLLDPAPGLPFWIILGGVSTFWAYPFALKLSGHFRLLALLSVQQLACVVLFTSFHYGGASSPFLCWVLAAPVSAYFYFGRQARLRSLALLLLAGDLLAFYGVYASGYGFPERIPLSAMSGVGIFSVFCAAVFIAMLSLNYANIVAAQQLDLEREVASRRETERALRAAVEKSGLLGASFRLLFDGNPIPMWVYDLETLHFLEVNDAAVAQYGYSREQFQSMTVDKIRPPEDGLRVRAVLKELITPYHRAGIWRHCKADGSVILVDVLWHRLEFQGRPAAIAAAIDVTERQESDRAIRDSEARYRLLAENITDVITVLALDGTRTYVSPSVRDVLGYEPAELIGRRMSEMPHPDDGPIAASATAALARGEPKVTITIRSRHKQGHYVWIETTLRLVRDPASGKVIEVLCVSRDVRSRKALQDQLATAKEQAERANRAKSEFLANMSHELRTPLNAIMGFGDLIANERFGALGNAKYADYGKDIVESGQHLLDLINEILDFAKVDAGRLSIVEETVDIAQVIDSCVHMLSDRIKRAGLTLETRLSPAVPLVEADERRLRQVMINLLSNAIKFTEPDGKLTIEAAVDATGRLAVSVADTGIGIAEQDLPQVLEPFGQVDGAFNRGREGTGLGLPLAKRLIEMHGGTLAIESRPGVGTTVTLWLPAERLLKNVA